MRQQAVSERRGVKYRQGVTADRVQNAGLRAESALQRIRGKARDCNVGALMSGKVRTVMDRLKAQDRSGKAGHQPKVRGEECRAELDDGEVADQE